MPFARARQRPESRLAWCQCLWPTGLWSPCKARQPVAGLHQGDRDYATNPPLYPRLHEYLRTSQVPALAVWGRSDQIFGPTGANAFADDAQDAEIHLLDGGHFLLESAGDEVGTLVRNFLARRLARPAAVGADSRGT